MAVRETCSSPLPTREASQRKRIRKTIGPDFVTDYLSKSPPNSAIAYSEPAAKRILRGNVRQENAKGSEAVVKVKPGNRAGESHPSNELDDPVCVECCSVPNSVPPTAPEAKKIVKCSKQGCGYAAHVGCLGTLSRNEPENSFRCDACKTCMLCGSGRVRKNNKLIQCSSCFRVFHTNCHDPTVPLGEVEILEERMYSRPGWRCSFCVPSTLNSQKKRNGVNGVHSSSRELTPEGDDEYSSEDSSEDQSLSEELEYATNDAVALLRCATGLDSRSSPDSVTNRAKQKPNAVKEDPLSRKSAVYRFNRYSEEISHEEQELRHDLSMWSVEQCAAYFIDSQPELAELIYKHELFGSSLILISRVQFMRLFGLSVGKTLKFFNAICKWRKMTF